MIVVLFAEILMDSDKPSQEPIFRPHLAIAVFCEKVLKEADGVLSLIRVVDRFRVPGTSPEMQKSSIRFTMVIMFRSGFIRGKTNISVTPYSPSKKELPGTNLPVLFEGDDERGVVIAAEINFAVEEEGLYWFDLAVMGEVVTRMPLRIEYQQTAIQGKT